MPTIYVRANDRQDGESLIFLLTNVKKNGIRVAYPEERFYAPPVSYWGEGRGRLPGKECISYLGKRKRRLIVANWSRTAL